MTKINSTQLKYIWTLKDSIKRLIKRLNEREEYIKYLEKTIQIYDKELNLDYVRH